MIKKIRQWSVDEIDYTYAKVLLIDEQDNYYYVTVDLTTLDINPDDLYIEDEDAQQKLIDRAMLQYAAADMYDKQDKIESYFMEIKAVDITSSSLLRLLNLQEAYRREIDCIDDIIGRAHTDWDLEYGNY